MTISHELEREYREISRTKFWKMFREALDENRLHLTKQLERGATIGTPCTRGEVWQNQIRTIDFMVNLPYKIIGYEGENPPEDGTL